MSVRPAPRPGVLDIAAYVPGRSRAVPGVKLHKLSSNETPLGPSPAAVEAYQRVGGDLERYPDGAATELREAIGAEPAISGSAGASVLPASASTTTPRYTASLPEDTTSLDRIAKL